MTKEELTTQSPEDVRLQQYRSSLMASGGAMVLFSLWTVLRSIVEVDALLNTREYGDAVRPLLTTLLVLGGIDLFLKLYVGLSARLEGLGRNKKRPYLVLGIIIACFSVLSVIYTLVLLPQEFKVFGLIGSLVTLVVEATVLYAAMDLVISAIKVRRLEQEMGRV